MSRRRSTGSRRAGTPIGEIDFLISGLLGAANRRCACEGCTRHACGECREWTMDGVCNGCRIARAKAVSL